MFASMKIVLAASGAASVALVGCNKQSEAPKPVPKTLATCQTDQQCDANTEKCVNSICVPAQFGCGKDDDCSSGQHCSEHGICVENSYGCKKDSDCSADQKCNKQRAMCMDKNHKDDAAEDDATAEKL